jgi:hypothetical protein
MRPQTLRVSMTEFLELSGRLHIEEEALQRLPSVLSAYVDFGGS